MTWLANDGSMWRRMMRSWLGARELGRDHEILLAQGEEAAAHDARQLGPADQRDDERDGEIDLRDAPGVGQRGGQPHPQRNGRNRTHDLDQALDQRVDRAAIEARHAAEQDAQQQAEGDARQPDRQRNARRHDQARVEIAAELVGAEQEDAVRTGWPPSMPNRWRSVGIRPKQIVGIAMHEERHRQLARRIGRVGELEGLGIAHALQAADMRLPAHRRRTARCPAAG